MTFPVTVVPPSPQVFPAGTSRLPRTVPPAMPVVHVAGPAASAGAVAARATSIRVVAANASFLIGIPLLSPLDGAVLGVSISLREARTSTRRSDMIAEAGGL